MLLFTLTNVLLSCCPAPNMNYFLFFLWSITTKVCMLHLNQQLWPVSVLVHNFIASHFCQLGLISIPYGTATTNLTGQLLFMTDGCSAASKNLARVSYLKH